MKKRTGYVYFDQQKQTWTARITFTDEFGKRRNVKRTADSEAAADKTLRKLLNDFEDKAERAIDEDVVAMAFGSCKGIANSLIPLKLPQGHRRILDNQRGRVPFCRIQLIHFPAGRFGRIRIYIQQRRRDA